MASLPTGSSRVSVMPQAPTVDPRLLRADPSRFFDGVSQGLSIFGRGQQINSNATQQRELNESAGMRRRLGEIQLANAEEGLANAPTRAKLDKIKLDELETRAGLPVPVQDFGVNRYGGVDLTDPNSPAFSDLVEEQVTLVVDPVTKQQFNQIVPKVIKTAAEVQRDYITQQQQLANQTAQANADLARANSYGRSAKKQIGGLQYDSNGNGFMNFYDPATDQVTQEFTGAVWQQSGNSSGGGFLDDMATDGWVKNASGQWVKAAPGAPASAAPATITTGAVATPAPTGRVRLRLDQLGSTAPVQPEPPLVRFQMAP